MFDLFVMRDVHSGGPNHLGFLGQRWPASYGDVMAGLTFDRTVVEEIVHWLQNDTAIAATLLGASGVGKTTAARQSLCHLVRVPADCYRVGSDTLREAQLQTDGPEWIEKILILHQVANLATTSEDYDLADTVRDVLVNAAAQSNTPERVVVVLNGIFLSAGSRREYELRESWFQSATHLVAYAMPVGIPAGAAAAHLGSSLRLQNGGTGQRPGLSFMLRQRRKFDQVATEGVYRHTMTLTGASGSLWPRLGFAAILPEGKSNQVDSGEATACALEIV